MIKQIINRTVRHDNIMTSLVHSCSRQPTSRRCRDTTKLLYDGELVVCQYEYNWSKWESIN